ncbi:hypothetical protein AAEX37_00639 [Oligella sp. MSHR50489EDL]|uniref:DMT family transporter n=1 Tax=Oligella sp. MSHR50489EDL TaxID=3139409 RepID=UPI003D816F2B
MLLYYLLACSAAIAIAIQAPINSRLGQDLLGQPLLAALISFSVGTIALFLVCLFRADFSPLAPTLGQQPLWKFSGGLLGAFMVFCSAFLPLKIGLSNFLFVVVFTQILVAIVVDHFGLIGMPVRPVDVWRILGALISTLGLFIFFFGEKIAKQFLA